jgi:regulatory protein
MDAAALRARALRWLAQREHSRSELRRKLLRQRADVAADAAAETDPGLVERVLDALQQQGWLSDERFAASRVRTRAPRQGLQRIRAELARHGLALDAGSAAALRASELERAHAVWQRKFGQPAADAAGRARQMRFLAGRGFDAEVIRRVLAGAADADGAHAPDPGDGSDGDPDPGDDSAAR